MKKPLVLIVDDFEDSRDMYGYVLSEAGFQVESAADGHEGLDKAVRSRPDIILMDLSLPDLDGWEVIRLLKDQESTRHIPVVILTAYDLPTTPLAGCDGVLIKPCRPDKLIAEVRRLLVSKGHPGSHPRGEKASARSQKA